MRLLRTQEKPARHCRFKTAVLMALWVTSTLALFGQQDPRPRFSVRVELVSLDVEVLDRDGNPVADLDREDFRIHVDKTPVEITNFARLVDRPVSLAIVLDVSGMDHRQLSLSKKFIFHLIHRLAPDDEICFYTFDTKDAYLEQDFVTDRIPLLEALRNIDIAGHGKNSVLRELFGKPPRTALAIDTALLQLRRGRNGKKAVLVISNRFRGLGPVTVEHIEESGYTLFTLEFKNRVSWLVTLGGDAISKKALLRQSGGRRFLAQEGDMIGTCNAIVHSLKNHYSLGFPAVFEDGGRKARRLQVLVPDTDYAVYARRSHTPLSQVP